MAGETVKDPICGRELDPLRARAVGIFGGVTYYFCSVDCKGKFSDPRKTPRRVEPLEQPEAHAMLVPSPVSLPDASSTPTSSVAPASAESDIVRTDKVAPLPPPERPRARVGLLMVLLVLTALFIALGAHLTRP